VIRPVIDSTFPLREAARAHERMESGQHIGRIVLTSESGLRQYQRVLLRSLILVPISTTMISPKARE
jgi:hypothetical protein